MHARESAILEDPAASLGFDALKVLLRRFGLRATSAVETSEGDDGGDDL
jgi:hypothetical protein